MCRCKDIALYKLASPPEHLHLGRVIQPPPAHHKSDSFQCANPAKRHGVTGTASLDRLQLRTTSLTCNSPWKDAGRETPPAALWGPRGRAAMRAFSRASACSTALATALMTTSLPTAASATAVSAGGMLISSRFGSTISLGKSTVKR